MRIGVDLGGTKTEIIALADDGKVRLRRRIATPRAAIATPWRRWWRWSTWRSASSVVGRAWGRHAGAISPASGLIKNANSTCLNGQALDRDLSRGAGAAGAHCQRRQLYGLVGGDRWRRGGRGLRVRGDHRHRRGRRRGDRHQGAHRAERDRGRVGPQPAALPDADDLPLPPCYCGRRGCVETYLCGPGW